MSTIKGQGPLDVDVEVRKIVRLASWIDPQAGVWLASVEQVTAISKLRPVSPPNNVMVVAGADAWTLYNHARAYVYPEARAAKLTEYVAFYSDQEIKASVPKIRRHFQAVDWTVKNMRRLRNSPDPDEKALGHAIGAGISNGFTGKAYQVYLLSGPNDAETIKLPAVIAHERRGRGSAFVRSWRYLPLAALQSARDTAEL